MRSKSWEGSAHSIAPIFLFELNLAFGEYLALLRVVDKVTPYLVHADRLYSNIGCVEMAIDLHQSKILKHYACDPEGNFGSYTTEPWFLENLPCV